MPGFSTTLCTGVMKDVILNNGSKVYACPTDASKAFDFGQPLYFIDKLL